MTDYTPLQVQQASVSVELRLEPLSPSDLNDLCDATDAAIEGGGGFGWLHVPEREMLERYWEGVITAPTRLLFIARLDGVICGTTQMIMPPSNNEAQKHVAHLTTHFVAPWARGYGLAKKLLEAVEAEAVQRGYAVINLDVRKTMTGAIALYESLGYIQFGEHPFSVVTPDGVIPSLYYYKLINPEYMQGR